MQIYSIGVLITCHNRKEKTLKCLKSLFIQRALNEEFTITVFLVDDGSTDETAQSVIERFPDVKVITGNGNLYWNRGMHRAWSEASKDNCDYYLWLNDDTQLYEPCISELLSGAIETKNNAIIVGTTRSQITGEATYGGRTIAKEVILPNDQLQACDNFNGNCVLIPKRVFEAVGNLDYKFHHAIGDLDYGRRAAKKGIISYVSYGYVGECERHDTLPKWCSPSVKLIDRIKAVYTPLGINPLQYFRYEHRHIGLFTAVKHFITIHLRLLFPILWEGKYKI